MFKIRGKAVIFVCVRFLSFTYTFGYHTGAMVTGPHNIEGQIEG